MAIVPSRHTQIHFIGSASKGTATQHSKVIPKFNKDYS